MDFWFFGWIFGFFSKLSRFKVTKVTTEHQKWPKIAQNSISFFCCCPKNPLQKIEVGPRSGKYLLVLLLSADVGPQGLLIAAFVTGRGYDPPEGEAG